MELPANGAKVHVWPTLPNVQDGENAFGRFMKPEGREVAWSTWWFRRLRDGEIALTNPAPAPKRGK